MNQPIHLERNFCLDTDAYKLTQPLAYRKDMRGITSYCESRLGSQFTDTIFYWLQPILYQNFVGQVITYQKINQAEDASFRYFDTKKYFEPLKEMYHYILKEHGGHLPVRIKAVKEGTRVPIGNVLFTIESLDNKCLPLVQHMETLLMQVWDGTTIGTNSFYIKGDIGDHLLKSGTPELLPYMCHDFGFRSTTCLNHAAVAGSAHLISFMGSDTLVAERAALAFYGSKNHLLKSCWASEHGVALQYGAGEGEYDYVKACLAAMDPDKIGSIVIDTFDDRNFIDNVITRPDIMELVLARNAKTVWRQDSGDALENTNRNLVSLANSYGHSYNNKHYKVLNPKVGLLQGDGITRFSMNDLYRSIISNKWSADNLVVGSGSGLLVKGFERDTQRFAIKPSQIEVGAPGHHKKIPVQKTPKGQPDKASKPGELKLHEMSKGRFMTMSSADKNTTPEIFAGYRDSLEVVFEKGELKRHQTFDEIKEIANSYM